MESDMVSAIQIDGVKIDFSTELKKIKKRLIWASFPEIYGAIEGITRDSLSTDSFFLIFNIFTILKAPKAIVQ
jgi:hypothetical protein